MAQSNPILSEVSAKIHQFWFKELKNSLPAPKTTASRWFQKDALFDEEIKKEFGAHVEEAIKGNYSELERSPQGILSLIILLDQFTRNIFRNTPKMFSADEYATKLAMIACENGFIKQLQHPIERIFLCMPFMHSESSAIHYYGFKKFQEISHEFPWEPFTKNSVDYFKMHTSIIDQFRRYPHRNQILGRESTPQEIEFLKTHSGF